jgi:hypothetical protein
MSKTTSIKERPILFSAPMVRAILAGTKTQTRRIVKPQPSIISHWDSNGIGYQWEGIKGGIGIMDDCGFDQFRQNQMPCFCPHGTVGDRLWVRESGKESEGRFFAYDATPGIAYESTTREFITVSPEETKQWTAKQWRDGGWKTRPSIHMPRWASRITLEITDIRVERVQDISEEDARAEGATPYIQATEHLYYTDSAVQENLYKRFPNGVIQQASYRNGFMLLWDSINGKKPGCDWKSNPWVWAISFKRVEAGQ